MTNEEIVKYLESLTPGGSEFHNSPRRCLEWIAGRLQTTGKLAAERNSLHAQVKALREELGKGGIK